MNFEAVRPFFQPISSDPLDELEREVNQARKHLAVGLDEVGMADIAKQVSTDSCGVPECQPRWSSLMRQDWPGSRNRLDQPGGLGRLFRPCNTPRGLKNSPNHPGHLPQGKPRGVVRRGLAAWWPWPQTARGLGPVGPQAWLPGAATAF